MSLSVHFLNTSFKGIFLMCALSLVVFLAFSFLVEAEASNTVRLEAGSMGSLSLCLRKQSVGNTKEQLSILHIPSLIRLSSSFLLFCISDWSEGNAEGDTESDVLRGTVTSLVVIVTEVTG